MLIYGTDTVNVIFMILQFMAELQHHKCPNEQQNILTGYFLEEHTNTNITYYIIYG